MRDRSQGEGAGAAIDGLRRALGARLSRRAALQGVGVGLGFIAGCASDGDGTAVGGTGGQVGTSGGGGSGGTTGTGSATAWATGGTAAMLAVSS